MAQNSSASSFEQGHMCTSLTLFTYLFQGCPNFFGGGSSGTQECCERVNQVQEKRSEKEKQCTVLVKHWDFAGVGEKCNDQKRSLKVFVGKIGEEIKIFCWKDLSRKNRVGAKTYP